jgi:hypothetical protein
MKQIIRELKRQVAGEKLAPEQLKGLIRAGYVYRNGDEHLLTDMGRDALAQLPGRGCLSGSRIECAGPAFFIWKLARRAKGSPRSYDKNVRLLWE